MALGQQTAGQLGLASADVVLQVWQQQQLTAHPWVFARYLPESSELSITAIKTVRSPDGTQRVVSADYTPQHGRWEVVRRSFLSAGEQVSPYTRGVDPYLRHAGQSTDPTFYNVSPGAAQVYLGLAMAHYGSPYGVFVEASTRLNQTQSKSGGLLRKTTTTHTTGYAKPTFYLAAPMSMSALRSSASPGHTAAICPRVTACTDARQIAYSGLQLEHIQGGNVPASLEEVVYSHTERKRSFTGLAFALFTVALVWAGGAIIAGSPAWAVSGGQIVAAASLGYGVTAGAIAGTTIAAGFGAGYAAISALDQGVQLNDPQKRWLGDMGLQASQVPLGTGSPAPCTNAHCSGTRSNTSARHIQSSTNLAPTRELVQGNCDVRLSRAQCLAQGLNPGQTPRSDSHPSAVTAQDFERKRQACLNAGQGVSQAVLYRCMATAVYFTE